MTITDGEREALDRLVRKNIARIREMLQDTKDPVFKSLTEELIAGWERSLLRNEDSNIDKAALNDHH